MSAKYCFTNSVLSRYDRDRNNGSTNAQHNRRPPSDPDKYNNTHAVSGGGGRYETGNNNKKLRSTVINISWQHNVYCFWVRFAFVDSVELLKKKKTTTIPTAVIIKYRSKYIYTILYTYCIMRFIGNFVSERTAFSFFFFSFCFSKSRAVCIFHLVVKHLCTRLSRYFLLTRL